MPCPRPPLVRTLPLLFALPLLAAASGAAWFVESDTAIPAKAEPRVFSMAATAADVDGDGDSDLVIATEYRPNRLLINDGTGRFSDESDARLPRKAGDHEDVAVADFDRDGDLDLLFVGEDDQVVGFFINDSRGFFTDASDRLPPTRGTANGIVAVDVDRDGDMDVVLANAGRDFVWINDGTGRWRDESDARLPASASVSQDIVAGDIDRDGDADLVFGNEDGNAVLLNDGMGRFVDVSTRWLPSDAPRQESRNVDLADVDGDGDLDLYVSNVRLMQPDTDPQDRLLINRGGRFVDETARRLPVRPLSTIAATFVDVDGDRDLDAVLGTLDVPQTIRTGQYDSRYRLLRNDGRGRFDDGTATALPATAVGHGFDVEPLDADGDGRIDLFLASRGGPDRLLLNRRAPGPRR